MERVRREEKELAPKQRAFAAICTLLCARRPNNTHTECMHVTTQKQGGLCSNGGRHLRERCEMMITPLEKCNV
jgi:hypothetical protein